MIRGETVWVLRPRRPDWSWVGAARDYAEGKSHRWRHVRRNIDLRSRPDRDRRARRRG